MATHLGNILRMTAQWRCILVMFLLLNGIADAQVRISEFMASNAGTLADEDGDFEDWIEIHNFSPSPVNLYNWSLTDNLIILFGVWLQLWTGL